MSRRRRTPWEGAYRALLLLYPGPFRDAHGDEMCELFRARLERAGGTLGRVALLGRMTVDTAINAVALRRAGAARTTTDEGRGDMGTGMGMGTLVHDVRYALRHLVRAPLFSLSAVALLAIGIGANVAVFTLVDALLLRPPPYGDPDRVVSVYQDSDEGGPGTNAFPAYRDMAASPVFSSVAATTPATVSLEAADGPTPASVEFTTASYLEVLGMAPARGRWFTADEDAVGGPMAAVVSHATWRDRFGSDPDIVGRTLHFNGQPVTVVGVGPEKLSGSWAPTITDFWLSISSVAVGGSFRVANLDRRQDHWYEVRGRLAPGVTVARAQEAMDALAQRMGEAYPDLDRGRGITVFRTTDVRLHPSADGMLSRAATLVMVVVGLVLLLACGNLANLLLVRGLGRSGEVAVRRALGASVARVARLFLAEALLLSVLGGLAGIGVAYWALGLVPYLPLPRPLSSSLALGPDVRVVAFTAALMVLTGVLFGLAPAVRSTRTDVAATLRDDARTAAGGRGVRRLRNVLVALQVAVSLVLVLGAGLLGRSLAALQSVDPGVDADRVAWVRTDFSQAGMVGEEARVGLGEVLARLSSLPGVTAVGATSRLPAQGGGSTTTVVEGYEPPSGTGAVELDYAVVSPGYFDAVGLSVLQGRGFGPDDVLSSETVVVVNQAAARRFWPGQDPIGRRMRPQDRPDTWRRVVGVVEDAPVDRLGEPPQAQFYFSTGQAAPYTAYLVARTDGDPAGLLSGMREAVGAVRSSLTVSAQGTLAAHLGDGLSGPRAATTAMAAFSFLGLLLAALGIYAVVAFSVARRSAELGIRIALGADRGGLVRAVVAEIVATVGVGLALGVGLCVLAAPRLGGALYGVHPLDPATFVGSVGILLLVSAAAAWLPARRASAVDPVEALRS